MKQEQKQIRINQLDRQMLLFSAAKQVPAPSEGWIYAIRTAIGMSLKQLGGRLGMTMQGVKDIERREKEGSITIQKLREVAAALDMQLVYALIPREESLDKMIEKRAVHLAREIVLKTAHTMHLEDQEINQKALLESIERRAAKIKNELPKNLWN